MPNFNNLALTVLEKSCSQTPKTPIFWAWRSGRLTESQSLTVHELSMHAKFHRPTINRS
ncbi:hypothetical protein WDU94_013553 [Cyamophila willieti]